LRASSLLPLEDVLARLDIATIPAQPFD
jgi:hypothetical protein